jgi:Arc/MetJ-type ribon-helix-helix transcriptional regulator
MKRVTVSLPDDLADAVRRAVGREGQVSSYVARALADYLQRESLDELLAGWNLETPVDDGTRRRVAAEHDALGLGLPERGDRMVG